MAGVDACIQDYLAYLAVEKGSSNNTVQAYRHDLSCYATFLAKRGKTNVDDVTREDITSYLADMRHDGKAPSTVDRSLSAIKGFHRFLVCDNVTENHPSATVPLQKTPERLPDTLSIEQVNRLLDQPYPEGPVGLRDHALLEVLYGCGLRASEAAGLDVGAVFLDEGLLRVFGKGSKERVVPICGSASKTLGEYLEIGRGKLAAHAKEPWARRRSSSTSAVHASPDRRCSTSWPPTVLGLAWKVCTLTPCATRLPRICWLVGRTSGRCRRCLVTPI